MMILSPAQFATSCQLAYDHPADVQGDHDVARAKVRRFDTFAVVALPGTRPNHVWDVLADLDAAPKAISDISLVHAGFWNAMLSVADQINSLVGDLPVYVTGHSLGGALAIALAAYRALHHLPVAGLVTFGAPRIAIGPHLGSLLGGIPMTLYRHAADPVPHLPLRLPIVADWEHPCALTQLEPDPHGFDFLRPKDSVERLIGDHAISLYVNALTAVA